MEFEEEKRLVFYRDVEMTPDWPERIRRAQQSRTYTIAGRQYPRVRYGCEGSGWHAEERACHDCAVMKGEFHVPGCDVEQCPECGGQAFVCACDIAELQNE
jgi:hypothetical protein